MGYTLLSKTGYVRIRTETGWDTEHRVVMERELGRKLVEGENVHHVNGDRADNQPENLELWVTAQPRGQRPVDLVEFARDILARYGTFEQPAAKAARLADVG